MTKALLILLGIYTFIIVYGIHKYEAKIKFLDSKMRQYWTAFYEKEKMLNDISGIIQAIDEQKQGLEAYIGRLKGENEALRSSLHTGFPSPYASSFETQMNEDTRSHADKLNDVWSKGGMGIVNMDITREGE